MRMQLLRDWATEVIPESIGQSLLLTSFLGVMNYVKFYSSDGEINTDFVLYTMLAPPIFYVTANTITFFANRANRIEEEPNEEAERQPLNNEV